MYLLYFSYYTFLEYDFITLNDLEVIGTLGIGGFGRVELVQYDKNPSLTFALKCLKKYHVVNTQQQDHVMSERNILLSCHSPFITRLVIFSSYKGKLLLLRIVPTSNQIVIYCCTYF